MSHTCPDGTRSKLVRVGPIGTMEGVTYHCRHCGTTRKASAIWADATKARAAIVARLSS